MTSFRSLLNRFRLGLHVRAGRPKPFASGIVEIFEPGSIRNRATDQRVELFDLVNLFGVLGLTAKATSEWIDLHGISSEDTDGNPIIPDYPIFLKVSWMHIDAARVSGDEIENLIEECERAESRSEGQAIQRDFFLIKDLAKNAMALNAEIQFCHP